MFAKLLEWLKRHRRWAVYAVGAVVVAGFMLFNQQGNKAPDVPLKQLIARIDAGQVNTVELDSKKLTATSTFKNGTKGSTAYAPSYEDELLNKLIAKEVDYKVVPGSTAGIGQLILDFLPLLSLFLVLFLLMRSPGQGMTGKEKKFLPSSTPNERFENVIGADEVLEEVQQIVRCLRRPRWHRLLGIRPLTGVVLHGPPGTGKTLLARAIAGEAGVPFFAVNGSDFDEMFMGVGAGRVRALFEEARKHKVAIVFIDEIDAVGSQRSDHGDSGSKGLNHTLNALLAEIDGFGTRQEGNSTVITIGATNRLESLDPALTRPGRLTRKVAMPTPDRMARQKILEFYAKKLPNLDRTVDFQKLSVLTSGMAGADLAELVNQAGLTAEREDYLAKKTAAEASNSAIEESDEIDFQVEHRHFLLALESVEIGPERKSIHVAQRDRDITATHEAGHAVASWFGPAPRPLRKVTIVPRGNAGGVTWAVAGDEQLLTVEELKSQLIFAMGARVAERLVHGNTGYTTGAHHDLEQATKIATAMVCELGMVGKYRSQAKLYPGDPRYAEIDKLILEAEEQATQILTEHRNELDALRAALLEEETLEGERLEQLLTAA